MRKYLAYVGIAFKAQMAYPGSMYIRGLRDTINILFFFILWGALFSQKQEISGYTFPAIISYYILAKLIDQLYSFEGARFLTEHIKNGVLSTILIQPVNYVLHLANYLFGRRVARVMTSSIIVTLFFIAFPHLVVNPPNFVYILTFIISGILSWLMLFEISFIVGTLAFWFGETSSIRNVVDQITALVGGVWIPLNMFPIEVQRVMNVLPFKYLYYNLINIYQGKIPQSELPGNLLVQVIWLIILTLILILSWKRGIKKYEAYGN